MRYWVDNNLEVHVASRTLPSGLMGIYNNLENTVLIDPRLTYAQKRCTLVHELVHWSHGDQGFCLNFAKDPERRTRLESAGILIDTPEYALLELEYGPDVWRIAEELELTPAIVRDYQNLVLPYRRLR